MKYCYGSSETVCTLGVDDSPDISLPPSEVDTEAIQIEVQEMHKALDAMEQQLRTGVPTCPPPEVFDCKMKQPNLQSFSDPRILLLEHNAKKLENQLTDLFKCSKRTRYLLAEIEHSWIRLQQFICHERRRCDALESLRMQMDREATLCRERYAYLLSIGNNWNELEKHVNGMQNMADNWRKQWLPKKTYVAMKRELFKLMKDFENEVDQFIRECVLQASNMEKLVNDEFNIQYRHTYGSLMAEMSSSISISKVWHVHMCEVIRRRTSRRLTHS